MTKQLFKFAGAVLDSYDDPVFVESAQARSLFGSNFIDPTEMEAVADGQFAVKIASQSGYKRRFPVYNADITKVSCLYYERAYADLPQEIQEAAGHGLAVACDHYGVEKTASVSKHAGSTSNHTVERITPPVKEFQIKLADLSKEAETRLSYELPKMGLRNRCDAATEMFKQAGTVTRQEVWDYVRKPVIGPMLDGALDDRAMVIKTANPDVVALFDHICNDLEGLESDQVVATLVEFDKLAGLDERYSGGFIDPYRAVYGGWPTPDSRDERNSLMKTAGMVDGQTGDHVSADVAKGLSVEKHLFNLQQRYPRNTESFQKAAAAGTSESMGQRYGPNYLKARQLYFGS